MDENERQERREALPEHEYRGDQGAGGATEEADSERLRALPEHERDERTAGTTSDYEDLTSAEATELDRAAVDPDDIEIDFDDRDDDNETPPITRSG